MPSTPTGNRPSAAHQAEPTRAPEALAAENAATADHAPPQAAENALDTALGVAEAGAARVLDGVADMAEGAINAIADLFGGGSSAPTPKQEQPPPAQPQMTAKERREARFAAFVAAEREQRKAVMQEIAKSISASEAMTPEELQREKEAQAKRSRDRGGGMSR